MFSYGVRFLFPPPPIGSWESLVDVVAGSSPVGGTRSYCIPNRAGESQFPSVSPPEPTIGLSPRVRGNRSGSPVATIPACAGESVATRAIPACAGERSGSIPACAGEPASHNLRTTTSRVYPRVCGGTLRPRWSRRSVVGLSPRVRGNRRNAAPCQLYAGSIPACAGEPNQASLAAVPAGLYPRRGNLPAGLGLSPRVRGNHFAYPRVCTWSLSPRVRGNRWCRVYPRVCGGTTRVDGSTAMGRVYPRVCGGTSSHLEDAFATWGLSPRVRGNRTATGA